MDILICCAEAASTRNSLPWCTLWNGALQAGLAHVPTIVTSSLRIVTWFGL